MKLFFFWNKIGFNVDPETQKNRKITEFFFHRDFGFRAKKSSDFFPEMIDREIRNYRKFLSPVRFRFLFQPMLLFFAAVKMHETNVMSRSWRPFPQKRCPFGYLVPKSKFNFIFMSSRWEVLLCSQLFCLGTMWLTISLIVLTIVANLHIFGKKIIHGVK